MSSSTSTESENPHDNFFDCYNKSFIKVINTLTQLLGISAFISWLFFSFRLNTWWCQNLHPNPLLHNGFTLLKLSLLRPIWTSCSFFRRTKAMIDFIYFSHILGLLAFVFIFTLFALAVTQQDGRGFREVYDLTEYSPWLRMYMSEADDIGKCLRISRLCEDFSSQDYFNPKFTPIESGCCKPPSNCNFEYKNATVCLKRPSNLEIQNPGIHPMDCLLWFNQDLMGAGYCHSCYSCKAGVLANMRMEWRHMARTNVCILISIVIVYLFDWYFTPGYPNVQWI